MPDSVRVLCLGFGRSEQRMMALVLQSAAHTLPRGFRIIKANEVADVVVVNWSTLNIERTQAFLNQRLAEVPLISVSETGVLGAPGLCIAEDLLLQSLAGLVYEAIDGIDPASRAKPPEYVSWLSMRRSWMGEVGPLRLLDESIKTYEDLPQAEDKRTESPVPEARETPNEGFEVRMDRLPRTQLPKPATPFPNRSEPARNEQPGVRASRPEPPNSLPIARPTKTAPPVAALPIHPLNRLKVLLVTPSPEAVQSDLSILSALGAEVQVISTEADTLPLFAKAAVDLVLIDARWTDEQGYRLCRTLAHHQSKTGVPIIMVAADLRPIERARAAYAGSQGLMRWPITEQQLIERVPPAMAWSQKGKPIPTR
ncbi:MAG: response regulator [Ahniella sp.]|nr:response regulator [Ahniella sp.]